MGQSQVLRRCRRGEVAALLRGEVFRDVASRWQRAFANEEVTPTGPRGEGFRRAGVACEDDPASATLYGICHTLRRVWNRMAGQAGAPGEVDVGIRSDLANDHGEPRRRYPGAVGGGKAIEQRYDADRADDLYRRAARRRRPV